MMNTLYLEYKMQSGPFRWLTNALLTAVIIFTAELGKLLGDQQQALAISVVWPPTGFALAGLLLLGNKVWPGIFLGNLIYDFIHLNIATHAIFGPLLIGTIMAVAAVIQAFLANFVIRKLSSIDYLKTVKDVFIFLIPGGLLPCLIASTVGVTALYLYGVLHGSIFQVWMEFWLGDSLGVYIFTPLLIVWTLHIIPHPYIKYKDVEVIFMIGAFILLTLLNFVWDYPLIHLYIPLAAWITYRFRMHGATLAIFIIALTAIIPTALGVGSMFTHIVSNQLILLVSFIEVIVATCLILGAVVNEREEAWELIQTHNIDLQEALLSRGEEIKELQSKFFVKEKHATLGLLTLGIVNQIVAPLEKINNLIDACKNQIEILKNSVVRSNEELPIVDVIKLEALESCIKKIGEFQAHANNILDIIRDQIKRTAANSKESVKTIDLHTLLSQCLERTALEKAEIDPKFTFSIVKEFDKTITMINVLPEDLAHAFMHLFNNSYESLKGKREALGPTFEPVLIIKTADKHEIIEITITDNGEGIPEDRVQSFFQSFLSSDQFEETTNLGLTLAHDIIVHVHKGSIKISSVEGQFLELTVDIPKSSTWGKMM